jgi:hypothetical protein
MRRGWTETVDAADISADAPWRLVVLAVEGLTAVTA